MINKTMKTMITVLVLGALCQDIQAAKKQLKKKRQAKRMQM